MEDNTNLDVAVNNESLSDVVSLAAPTTGEQLIAFGVVGLAVYGGFALGKKIYGFFKNKAKEKKNEKEIHYRPVQEDEVEQEV